MAKELTLNAEQAAQLRELFASFGEEFELYQEKFTMTGKDKKGDDVLILIPQGH